MTLQKLLDVLKNKFTIVGTIDLLHCEKNNCLVTEVNLFKNRVFSKNERLILIIDNKLKKSFDDMPVDILKNLQLYIKNNVIPHPFIIAVSNIPTIKEDLNLVHNMFFYQEDQPISTIFKYTD